MKQKAFTLIELLVVIAIIGFLASIVLVVMNGTREKAKITQGLQFGQTLQRTLGAYAVGMWSFDEGLGSTAQDTSEYRNNCTIIGATYTNETPHKLIGAGQGKYALTFNGSGNYAGCGDAANLNPTTMITIEAWVKMSDNGGQCGGRYATIVGKGMDNHYQLRLSGDAEACKFRFGIKTNTGWHEIPTPETYSNSVWYHVAGTYDGSKIKLYVNGAEKASESVSGSIMSSVYPVEIARRPPGGYYFKGIIDEVRIYTQSLSITEIQKRYTQGLTQYVNIIETE